MKRHKTPSVIKRKRSERRSASPKMWVLRDPATLNLLFQTFEDLTTLRQRCARQVAAAREDEHVFGHVLLNPDQSGLRRWRCVSEMVTTSWSVLGDIVRTNRLDPAQCQETYRYMLWIRTVWARLDPRSNSLPLIDQITDHLRRLLIGWAQAQGQQRRSPS